MYTRIFLTECVNKKKLIIVDRTFIEIFIKPFILVAKLKLQSTYSEIFAMESRYKKCKISFLFNPNFFLDTYIPRYHRVTALSRITSIPSIATAFTKSPKCDYAIITTDRKIKGVPWVPFVPLSFNGAPGVVRVHGAIG